MEEEKKEYDLKESAPAYQSEHSHIVQDDRSLKKQHKKEKLQKRIWELDFLRGVAIVLMLLDHFLYDVKTFAPRWQSSLGSTHWFVEFGKMASWYWVWNVRKFVWVVVVSIFLVTSGASSVFSRSQTMRAVKLSIAAVVISLVTITAKKITGFSISIYFGIVHCFALSMWIFVLLKKLKANNITFLIVAFLFVIVGVIVQQNQIYVDHNGWAFLGIRGPNHSADYFPILPWGGAFFMGVVYGDLMYSKRKTTLLPALKGSWSKPICFVGRHTIWIYLLHQIVLFGSFYVVGKMFF